MKAPEPYQQMYLTLFNRVTDAIAALEQGRIALAKDLLVQGQQDAEDLYMADPT